MWTASTNEAAQIFGVTEKTVRSWVDEGLPVVKRGKRGAGNAHVVDMVGATLWYSRKNGLRMNPAGFLEEQPPALQNPAKWAVEQFFEGALQALAAACVSWYADELTTGGRAWEKAGLTDEQARAILWPMFGNAAMFLLGFKTDYFERQYIEPSASGMDLDGLMSMLIGSEIETKWKDTFALPKSLEPYLPAHLKTKP